MRIKRLKLTGFKSFVEPAELRIEPGLTGVVGPNGCGKSNLLEAIRWVMGESSPKSMRGGGMEPSSARRAISPKSCCWPMPQISVGVTTTARWKSSAGSSAGPALLTGSTAATCAPRTSR
jgi:energy-coupling factor transporter ATP-binding protein EcfA2